jgi:hypothetical protein
LAASFAPSGFVSLHTFDALGLLYPRRPNDIDFLLEVRERAAACFAVDVIASARARPILPNLSLAVLKVTVAYEIAVLSYCIIIWSGTDGVLIER